jgi:hypothetical protein
MGKKSRSGSGIWDEHPRSYFRELRLIFGLKILKFFDADPDPGSGILWSWIRDGKIRIRNPEYDQLPLLIFKGLMQL